MKPLHNVPLPFFLGALHIFVENISTDILVL